MKIFLQSNMYNQFPKQRVCAVVIMSFMSWVCNYENAKQIMFLMEIESVKGVISWKK